MRIGIDARLYGLEHAGLGRYVMRLVEDILKLDKKNDYVLFLKKAHAEKFKNRKRVKVVVTNIPIYSFAEQTILPFIFAIVPSNFVKEDVVKRLHVPSEKITVTYEAATGSIKEVALTDEEKIKLLDKYHLTQPFIVYTGSVYPHKNVDILVQAIEKHNQNKEVDLQLALICSRSVFWERLNQKIVQKNLQNRIKLLGFVEDEDVSKLYSLALALVHPSKMEGFGLTGLEAMSVGLPVISSNASCLPEVYGDAALYFNPDDVDDLVSCLETYLKDQDLRFTMSTKGYQQARIYSWQKMAKETLAVYKQLLSK